MLRWRSGFSQTQAWTGLRTDRQRDRRVSRETGEQANTQRDRQVFTPVGNLGRLQAGVLHHTGNRLSRSVATHDRSCQTKLDLNQDPEVDPEVDSPGRVLQVGVDLVVPIAVCQLVSGGDPGGDFLSVSTPAHFDVLGVEVVDAADQHGWVSTSRGLHRVDSDVGLSWNGGTARENR